MSKVINYGKTFMQKFQKDNVPTLAAAQAYYYLLASVPLLVVCFTIIPYLNVDPNDIVRFIEKVLPSGIGTILEENIISLVNTPRGGLLTVGIIGALWSSSAGINAFIKATNQAYEVEESRNFIVVRLIALGLTLGMILALGVAILLPVFGSVLLDFAESFFGLSAAMTLLFQVLRWVVSVVVITLLLAMLYKLAPDKNFPFKHVLPGAVTASVLWMLVSLGFSFYVSNFGSYSATYGSLGGVIVLMIWFFLTGLILMIGAIVNVLYHRKHSHDVKTSANEAANM
ncbi:putative ribonuclease-like protein YfkH [Lentibacillus sp. JNUCC-1]|uniref:YihY/virulence factor BrkB family protein n=1 Tax=Lentibacillus sp. JNUCC-1 TaxID=2654513 RepID=UPI0012E8A5D0|nr:YihY/virulence factor BrkB family protein [Lentibacillus sp. JNUCC-1]MUV38859.1 putative ribonuclease-like protein YfkH [Lentibacillus sp. JNUCC-1]